MNPRSRFLLFGPALVALALRSMGAQAQPPASPASPRAGASMLAQADRMFIKDAAGSGRFAVDTSQLAMQQAASPQVREFAAMLVRDHKAADAGLLRLSHARGITPPMMTGGHRKTLNQLAKAHGAGFDRIYLQQVGLQAHRDSIKSLEAAASTMADPQLRAWIDETLPMLRNHLAQAQKLAGRR